MDERLTRWLLATLLSVFLLLLSLPSSRLGDAPALIERGVLRLAATLADGVDRVGDAFAAVGEGWRTRRRLKHENQRLSERVEQLELDNLRLSTAMGRLWVLEHAQGFLSQSEADLTPAEVVFRDDRSSIPSWIARAPAAKWRVGQPVLAQDGVAGRVTSGAANYVKIRPLTDYDHAMGAMVERTRRQGVVRGAGESRLRLEYIPRGSDVRLGDLAVTSGTDGVFPRGLPIGEVVTVEESDDLLLHIGVRPLVDFSKLEVVYLLGAEVVSPQTVTAPESSAAGQRQEQQP